MRLQFGKAGVTESVTSRDVHGHQFATRCSSGDTCGPTHENFAFGTARQSDHDALARLPRPGDPVLFPVALHAFLDAIGEP